MALFLMFSALIIQSSLTIAADDLDATREVLKYKIEPDHDWSKTDNEWSKINFADMFKFQDAMFPTSSVAMMSQATNGNKTAEEKVKEIKYIAEKISACMQSEIADLLAFALKNCDKEDKEDNDTDAGNSLRKKRSVETPMDSSQLVMRLLKHIKANNEYQNIAIEKMMSAQEIADKYGIEFNPDPEILTDLAVAANEHTKDLSEALSEALEVKNMTHQEEIKFVPMKDQILRIDEHNNDGGYYIYSTHPEAALVEKFAQEDPFAPYEYAPQQVPNLHEHQHHYEQPHYHYTYPTPAPPVTERPNYYESMMGYAPEYFSYCPVEPVTTTTTIYLPIEDQIEAEPELVREEYEETVTSKVSIDRDQEPGSATVNHVMTYTINEKAHFKAPEIERLPQQMQYTFFLI